MNLCVFREGGSFCLILRSLIETIFGFFTIFTFE